MSGTERALGRFGKRNLTDWQYSFLRCREAIVTVMRLNDWAFDVARSKLEHSLPLRWAHVQGVALKARSVRAVAGPDADLLEAAAVLHDVGYAPDLAGAGFHPLDGAVFLAEAGAPDRLVNLVAHHYLRHTGNQLTAEAGANLRELMARMGHDSTRAALIYLHTSDARQRVIADQVGKLARKALGNNIPGADCTGTRRARGQGAK